jgi:23S rRNA (guanine745-N1)-methyltransferase
VALDASRYAAGRSAGADSRIGSVLADAWSRLPVRAGVASTVLSVFAPRDPAEIGRVLAPQGRVVVVTPEPDHLAELRSGFGLLSVDPGKTERLDEAFAGLLQTVERVELRQEMVLSPEDVHALIRMGPSAHHLQPEHLALAVRELAVQTTVTLSVTISVLQRDSSPRSLGDRRH